MPKLSAGLLLFRVRAGAAENIGDNIEVLIVHPGGPFWARKDDGAWSVPKGEYDISEEPWEAAQREFAEELGLPVPDGTRIELGQIKQPGGKIVTAYAVGADLDIAQAHSNTFELEWPRGSGRIKEFPEVDRVAWLPVEDARVKLLKGQQPFLDRLLTILTEHPA